MMTPDEHCVLISDAIAGNIENICHFVQSKVRDFYLQCFRIKYDNDSHSTDADYNAISLADVVCEVLDHEQVDVNVKLQLGGDAIFQAILWNHDKLLRELLRYNTIDVNTSRDGQTLLIMASTIGHAEVVRELLKHDEVDVNASCPSGTALTLAAEWNHAEVVSMLLNDERLNMNARNLKRLTAVFLAREKKNPNYFKSRIVCELSQAKLFWASENGYADMVVESLKCDSLDVNLKTYRGRTPLIVASERGHLKVVREFLKLQAVNVNAQDDDGRTPLIMASSVGHVKMVLALLKHPKLIVNAKDNTGRSALTWAGELGRMGVVRALLKHARVDVLNENHDCDCTSLISWIYACQVKVFREPLASQKLDVNAKNDHGTTALILASELGPLERVRNFPKNGKFEVNVETRIGGTALMIASDKGYADIALAFLNNWRVDVNVDNGYICSSLVLARHQGHAKVVHKLSSHSLLLANTRCLVGIRDILKRVKVDMHAMTSRDRTALTVASEKEHLRDLGEVLKFMDANAGDYHGWAALCLASEEGHFGVVLFKRKAADASVKSDNGAEETRCDFFKFEKVNGKWRGSFFQTRGHGSDNRRSQLGHCSH